MKYEPLKIPSHSLARLGGIRDDGFSWRWFAVYDRSVNDETILAEYQGGHAHYGGVGRPFNEAVTIYRKGSRAIALQFGGWDC